MKLSKSTRSFLRKGTLHKATLLTLASFWLSSEAFAYSPTAIASRGYIYGFPLVLMEETFLGITGPERACGFSADVNTFLHIEEVPGPDFKAVVRPNVDTLYSTAMLDLSTGPQLLDMPAVSDRYVLMALLDAWSNNFAGIGTQTHGDAAGHYAIVGPNWNGDLPPDYIRIDAPTDLVWIIGRTEVLSTADIPAVNAIQHQYQLNPLLDTDIVPDLVECVPQSEKTPPIDAVLNLTGVEYFTRLSDLIERYPPPAEDKEVLRQLRWIGVGPDSWRTPETLTYFERQGLDRGAELAQGTLDTAKSLLGLTGWGPNPKWIPLGDYGNWYLVRAIVAQIGFGANRGEFAVYQNSERDKSGATLTGAETYTMTFAAGDRPPVNAFWSITVYGEDGFLRENPNTDVIGGQRYALSTNTPLQPNADGSVTIYLSHQPPADKPLSNWLPTPAAEFEATVRYYDPQTPILEADWKTPPIVRD